MAYAIYMCGYNEFDNRLLFKVEIDTVTLDTSEAASMVAESVIERISKKGLFLCGYPDASEILECLKVMYEHFQLRVIYMKELIK